MVNDGNAHSGLYAVKIIGSNIGISQTVVVKPNTTYTMTGWGKVVTPGETIAIGVKNYGGTETFYNFTTTSYTQGSITFTTGATNTSANIYFWRSSGTGTAYADDVVITEN